MLGLTLRGHPSDRLRILCLGAHADDIEIGCGGLILSLIKNHKAVEVDWVVFSAPPERDREARRAAALFLKGASRKRVMLRQFRDGFFPYQGADIKSEFERLKGEVVPDLILTHYRHDRHQDHRVLSDLTWNTFRDHLVIEYEVPKYDGDLGTPNFFLPLDQSTSDRKLRFIHSAFVSQREKHWFSAKTFVALMRLRGMECRAPEGYAEAFYVRKLLLNVGGDSRSSRIKHRAKKA
jgi:LmbE family N-acetylglucosaminyl deacetylase